MFLIFSILIPMKLILLIITQIIVGRLPTIAQEIGPSRKRK